MTGCRTNKTLVKTPCLLILFLGIILLPKAAAQPVKGRVCDQRTGRPLAFVNIVYTSGGQGTVSNIDGEFSISSAEKVEFIKISYLGYATRYIQKRDIIPGKSLQVRLERKTYDIEAVNIRPGINPAHRLIRLALENRDKNNPEKMQSFSYTSYSKMYFTLDLDSMFADISPAAAARDSSKSLDPDDGLGDLEEFLDKNHLFLMEFVSERSFLQPDRNREIVKASRVSGFSDPSFTLLASQIQSFSFYEELISIWDRKYLNPISRGSTRKYLFLLEDTLYTEQQDTLFVISFRPLRGKNFDGLKGILHINSDGYAIQNVIAEAAEIRSIFRVKIQQKYEKIEDRQWFPVELNTDIMLSPENVNANRQPVTLIGVGKSYLSNIRLDPELHRRDFSQIEIGVEEDAHKKEEAFWEPYRVSPLSEKDRNTYRLIDSIGEEAHLDRGLKLFETFASGYIPAGFLNIDYQSLVHWSKYEGFRVGLSAETNDRVSRWVRFGGKLAYGIGDKEFKYGGHLRLNLNRRQDAFLKFSYDKDIVETAGWQFIEKPPVTSSEIFRSFLIASEDNLEQKRIELQFRALRYLKVKAYLSQQLRQVTGDYRFLINTPEGAVGEDRFHIAETGIMLKYAHKEKFLETPRGNRISLGTHYPVLYANLYIGIPVLDGEYEYTRLVAKLTKTFHSKSLGETRLAVTGGWTDRSLPYPLLFTGAGSYRVFTIETENSYATMRMNEFVSDRFASLHFQQDFGKLILRREKFQPGIVLVGNAGFGTMRQDDRHLNLDVKTPEKGYYESGLLFNNLLRYWIFGYGLGVFYRFGPYSLPETIDNFAFKFTIRFNL